MSKSEMQTYNYPYDDEGNGLTKTSISTGEREDYTWDHRNRLVKITFTNSAGSVIKTVDQTYDVFNRWIRRSVDPDGATGSAAIQDTFFAHEGGQVVLDFDGSAASDLTHRYLYSNVVDQILASEDVTSLSQAGNVLWPLSDHLGTTRDIADRNESTGVTTVTNHRRFDSYGNLIGETNSAVDLLFAFTGRPFDESTGLQNNLNRWYDPSAGRWISEDPIGFAAGDQNLTRYVGNSPLASIDPFGLSPDDPVPDPSGSPAPTPSGSPVPLPDDEDILESKEKQQELRQRKRPPSICDPDDEWDGARKRPKDTSMESISKAKQRAKNQRGGFLRIPMPRISMPKIPSMSPMVKETGPLIILSCGDGIMTHINQEYCDGELGRAADMFLWKYTCGLMGHDHGPRPRRD
jgi:RHS repeat-associated protein